MLRAPFVLTFLVGSASAQTMTVLVREGDVVPGAGLVTSVDNLAVNASGTWLVLVDTDNANLDADAVLLRNGAVQVQEGDFLPVPGAALRSVDPVLLGDDGHSGWVFGFQYTAGPYNGVYWDSVPVLMDNAVSSAPQFTPGTQYSGILEADYRPGEIVIIATVDDPAIPSTYDRALVLARVDGTGALLSESVIAKEGDVLAPLAPDPIVDIHHGARHLARAGNDFTVALFDMDPSAVSEGALVLFHGSSPTLLARAGSPSPIPARNWDFVSGRPVDVNDAGEYAFHASIEGSPTDDEVLVRNGTDVVAREGFSLPSTAPWPIKAFGNTGVRIAANGDVFWYGDWDDPDTTRDTGLFVNDTLLVQEGVTTVGGQTVVSIHNGERAFDISNDGRYLVFKCQFAGGIEATALLDRGSQPIPFCFGTPETGGACPCGNSGSGGTGCASSVNPAGARLATSGAASLSADTLVLRGSGMPDSSALYFQGTSQLGGGLGVAFGDGLRCAGGTVIRLGTKLNAGGASQYPTAGNQPVSVRGLVGAPGSRTYQVWYRNAAAFCTASTFNLSNGVLVVWES